MELPIADNRNGFVAQFHSLIDPPDFKVEAATPVSFKSMPDEFLVWDLRTNAPIAVSIEQLPADVKYANGIVYYGKKAADWTQVKTFLKSMFERGRSNAETGTFDLARHKSTKFDQGDFTGLFSTSTSFGIAQNYSITLQKDETLGIIFVIDGQNAPSIQFEKMLNHLNLQEQKYSVPFERGPDGAGEKEVGMLYIDPRQVKGAWIQRSTIGVPKRPGSFSQHHREYDYVPNPNYVAIDSDHARSF